MQMSSQDALRYINGANTYQMKTFSPVSATDTNGEADWSVLADVAVGALAITASIGTAPASGPTPANTAFSAVGVGAVSFRVEKFALSFYDPSLGDSLPVNLFEATVGKTLQAGENLRTIWRKVPAPRASWAETQSVNSKILKNINVLYPGDCVLARVSECV